MYDAFFDEYKRYNESFLNGMTQQISRQKWIRLSQVSSFLLNLFVDLNHSLLFATSSTKNQSSPSAFRCRSLRLLVGNVPPPNPVVVLLLPTRRKSSKLCTRLLPHRPPFSLFDRLQHPTMFLLVVLLLAPSLAVLLLPL
jgi:hypothetical protein